MFHVKQSAFLAFFMYASRSSLFQRQPVRCKKQLACETLLMGAQQAAVGILLVRYIPGSTWIHHHYLSSTRIHTSAIYTLFPPNAVHHAIPVNIQPAVYTVGGGEDVAAAGHAVLQRTPHIGCRFCIRTGLQ